LVSAILFFINFFFNVYGWGLGSYQAEWRVMTSEDFRFELCLKFQKFLIPEIKISLTFISIKVGNSLSGRSLNTTYNSVCKMSTEIKAMIG